MDDAWDLVVVGADPAGSAAAIGALQADPGARVLLLDRTSFPRDKACGDGMAPHVFDVLADLGVAADLFADRLPVPTLDLVGPRRVPGCEDRRPPRPGHPTTGLRRPAPRRGSRRRRRSA